MSWSESAYFLELDRKRLPNGLLEASIERPEKAVNHLITILSRDSITDYQKKNAIILVSEVGRYKVISDVKKRQVYLLIFMFIKDESLTVKKAAVYYLLSYLTFYVIIDSVRPDSKEISTLLNETKSTALRDGLDYQESWHEDILFNALRRDVD